jgi:uncharacterized protein (TIGR03435 family)
LAALLGLPHTATAGAQRKDAASSAFDVASVKRNESGSRGGRIDPWTGDRFAVFNLPLRQLVAIAYGVDPRDIVEGPEWVDADRYDVEARSPGVATGPEKRRMLQTLLAHRFGLQVVGEQRPMPVYELVVSGAPGRLAPRIRVSTADCAVLLAKQAKLSGLVSPEDFEGPFCGVRYQSGGRLNTMRLRLGAQPLSQLARELRPYVQLLVVDETGLDGLYDLEIEFSMEGTSRARPQAADPGAPDVAHGEAPSVKTALQEQLGLKLESARRDVKVLVIQRARRPTPN